MIGQPLIPLGPPPRSPSPTITTTSPSSQPTEQLTTAPSEDIKIVQAYGADNLDVEIACSYATLDSNGTAIDLSCETSNFTELALTECLINVTYTYSLISSAPKRIRVKRLIDESFEDLIDSVQILPPRQTRNIVVVDTIDLCQSSQIEKKVVAIASIVGSGGIQSLPNALNSLEFDTP